MRTVSFDALPDRLGAKAGTTLTALVVVLCLLGCSCVAHQPRLPTTASTQDATATPSSTPTSTCTPTLTSTHIPTASRTPVAAPGPLTDAQAVALIEKEMTARGVAPGTLRIVVAEEPRIASIRYVSSYPIDSRVFQAESVLIALAVARTVTRIEPLITDGIRLSVIPGGDSDVGLRVTAIEHSSLEAWSQGAISDQEFVSQWTIGAVTKE